jgi:hypothetical protein
MSYIGNEPIVSATRTVTEVTATAGQTVFTANGGYTVGFLDVFINGSKLTSADFTATDGSTVTLTEAAQASDIVRLEALGTFLTSSAMSNVNPSYTGTLTGGTDVVNIGSGQVYKDASGNFHIGTTTTAGKLTVSGKIRTLGGDIELDSGQITTNSGSAPLRLGVDGVERARLNNNGDFQFNSGYGSFATAYGCRAWVNFNGTGTVAIRGSGNVSSITDNGTGDYTVNFSASMPDANYATPCTLSNDLGSVTNGSLFWKVATQSSSAVRVLALTPAGAFFDPNYYAVSVFR